MMVLILAGRGEKAIVSAEKLATLTDKKGATDALTSAAQATRRRKKRDSMGSFYHQLFSII
jgi:hypothetical protein